MRVFISLLIVLMAAGAGAQGTADRAPLYIGSEAVRPAVAVVPGLQRYTLGEQTLTQLVVPVDVFVPLAERWAMSTKAAYASVEGDEMASLSGFGDVQFALSHVRPVGQGGVVGSVLINLPTGERTLTIDEAQTAFLVGQGVYGFRLPSLGQGFNVTPGVTLAVPVGERFSLGLGVAYQRRGAFSPQTEIEAAYDPADELLLTVGADVALGRRTTAAADVAVSLYGEDTWEGEAFVPGDAVTATAQVRTEVGPASVRLLGRVRSRGAGEAVGAGLRFGTDGTIPAQARGLAQVSLRLASRVSVGGLAQVRSYDASDLFDAQTVVDLRLTPRVRVGRGGSVLGRFGTTLGDVEGLEVGLGLAWAL